MKSIRNLVAMGLVASCSVVVAQTSFTSLRGTITDPAGALVSGAQVTVTNVGTGTSTTVAANGSGEYEFPQLNPGSYTITVHSTGFGTQSKTANLLVNQPATVNFKMAMASAATTVDVTAAAQTLNTTDATIGNSVSNAVIESLPMEGRNVPDLLSLQPGVLYIGRQVNQDNDSRSGSVAGARSDQTNVTLDGLDDNDQEAGYAFTGVLRSTLDSTEEFRVTTTGSNADAGRSSGAQVTLVTKSGGNQFHGAGYEYNRNGVGVANDWFNKAGQLSSGLPNRPGKLVRNTFGGSFGGPILKDKLFFFGNYEGQRTSENRQVTQEVPTASFRAGSLKYVSADDGSVITLSPSQVATLDQGCVPAGTCPWGPGADPNVLALYAPYPLPNGNSLGDGINLASFSFSSPYPGTLNTSIAKLDYILNERQHFFVRGNLQKDNQAGTEQFPGQPASSTLKDNTKGLAAGHTWSLTPNLVNDLRYGYIRQGFSNRGIGQGDYVDFRFIATATAETRTRVVNVPVHNIVDNLSWTKGAHTFGFGGNWRLIHNNRGTDLNSHNLGTSNTNWYLGSPPDPATLGLPGISSGTQNDYQVAYGSLMGGIPQITDTFNYDVSPDGNTGTALPDGTFLNRHFKANEFEYYLQDSWRARPNLTITFGIRHTILQTPYETKGQQISPTVDTHEWMMRRQAAADQGQVYEPLLEFLPNGPAHHRPGYWAKQKLNFAPRLATAYAPNDKTSIRAGFGIYYDHYGQGIVNTFDQNGSFGLSTSLSNPAGRLTTETAPRFTGRHDIPNIPLGVTPPTTTSFPYTPPDGAFLITWGADNHLKTPYSEAMDFSIQRQIPGGFTIEGAYVGRLGRHLLQALDLAEPVDFRDPVSGQDYFTAGSMLSKMVDQNHGDPQASVPAIPFFENVFPQMANLDYAGESATQGAYTNEWAPYRYTFGETTSLADIDFYCSYGCPYPQSKFWQSQFSSLYAWSSIGMSYYNSGQIIVRHPMSHGFQTDFSYTLSKSIDMGSDTERASEIQANGSFSDILNTWNPSLNRAPSDFDTRHLITLDWVYALPVGQGKALLGNTNRLVDAVLGGWQWSGLGRWTSGLPFGVIAPGWATDWQIQSYGVRTGPVKLRKHIDAGGSPQVFDKPQAINDGVRSDAGPIRLPYPGEAGERNNFRGDGYFDIDSGITKSWKVTEHQNLNFAWEVFNVTNSVRFDTNTNFSLSNLLTGGSLGDYSTTLSVPRVMQFSARYSF